MACAATALNRIPLMRPRCRVQEEYPDRFAAVVRSFLAAAEGSPHEDGKALMLAPVGDTSPAVATGVSEAEAV